MRIFLFIVIVMYSSNILSQNKWFSKFGWWGVDIGNDVVETMDGHYIVTGYTGSFTFGNSDVMVAKVNANGWLMWVKNIGNMNNDIGKAIVKTLDSGFVIAGYTNSYGNGGYDGYLIKVNKKGDLIWQKHFGGSDWDFFNSLQVCSDKGFVAVGYSYSNSKGGKDGWIVKTDSLGNIQWEKRIGGSNDDEFVSVEILHDNRIACFGTTYSFSDVKGNYCIFKTNNDGDSLFFKDFGTPDAVDIGYDFFERPYDSIFVIAGTSQSPFGTDTTYYHQLFVDSLCNFLFDVKETSNSLQNHIVRTNAYLNNTKHYAIYDMYGLGQGKREPGFHIFNNNWWMIGSTYGSEEDDYILSCKKTSDKGLIAVGYTYGFNALQEDVFIVKLDSTTQFANNVVSVLDIKDESKNISIYPNIASNRIYVSVPNFTSNANLTIYDMQGRIVKQNKVSDASMNIDISELQEGMYIVSIISSEYRFNGKFIKKLEQ